MASQALAVHEVVFQVNFPVFDSHWYKGEIRPFSGLEKEENNTCYHAHRAETTSPPPPNVVCIGQCVPSGGAGKSYTMRTGLSHKLRWLKCTGQYGTGLLQAKPSLALLEWSPYLGGAWRVPYPEQFPLGSQIPGDASNFGPQALSMDFLHPRGGGGPAQEAGTPPPHTHTQLDSMQ